MDAAVVIPFFFNFFWKKIATDQIKQAYLELDFVKFYGHFSIFLGRSKR